MSLLRKIKSPKDLWGLSTPQLIELATEIRQFLISQVSRTGGHLGPNLGVVELTIAMHRVFESPKDPFIFDTGHQSYVHKILTGRFDKFPSLRQKDGLSGYPSRSESDHDWVENSHASASLSWAEGMAKAFKISGQNRTVVAVIGDGALTGGMAWEALNNIAVEEDLKLVVIVNDNGRSYTPTVGGLALQLAGMRTDRRYERTLKLIKDVVSNTPLVGRPMYDLLHGVKAGLKDILAPQGLFSDLGLKYIGPVDGHDIEALETQLEAAKSYDGPVIVHAITHKGRGFAAAENHEEDQFHAVGKIDQFTGEPLSADVQSSWTDAFSDAIVKIGESKPEVVAMTAAMLHPVGLARFAAAFPERVFDVGIAEQHAVASAAGLASAGMHPVVAVYSTFLNRAFDQVLMDVGLHKCGVTFVLDRSGYTGPDGPSHHGMWDMALLKLVPRIKIASPRDQNTLEKVLNRAVEIDDRPTVMRFPKGRLAEDLNAIKTLGSGDDRVDVLTQDEDSEVLIAAFGPMAAIGMDVAARLRRQGYSVCVVDPFWAYPISPVLSELASQHRLVVTIEDGLEDGGIGSQLSQELGSEANAPRVINIGIPHDYIVHASREELLEANGLNARSIALRLTNVMSERIEQHPSLEKLREDQ